MISQLHPITRRAMSLSLGIACYELMRASFFVYSFRFEPSHLFEIFSYPSILVLCPLLLATIFTQRSLIFFQVVTWLTLTFIAMIPFGYERLLFAPHALRILGAVGGSALMIGCLGRAWLKGRFTTTRLELSCAFLYCVSIDSGLELSKMLLGLTSGQAIPWKVFLAWVALYLGLIFWLMLCQLWSDRFKHLLLLISLGALGHTALYHDFSNDFIDKPNHKVQRSLFVSQDAQTDADIFIIIFDAMRGDARSWIQQIEGEGTRLEAFEALAARSLDFQDAHSGSLATYESIPKLLELKGSQPFLRLWPLKNSLRWFESLPGRLQQLGYQTYLLSDYPNAVLKGFDAVDWTDISSLRSRHFRLLNLIGDLSATLQGSRALLKARRGASMASVTEPTLIQQFAHLLSLPKTAPRFIVLHLSTPHQPYAFPPYLPPSLPSTFDPEQANEDFLKSFQDADQAQILRFKKHYAYALQAADHALKQINTILTLHGRPQQDLVVVTSDHGELFGDHGIKRLAHGGHFYQASHHVPLFISGMGLTPQIVTEPVSNTRIASTIYDLLHIDLLSQDSLLQRKPLSKASFEVRYAQRGGVVQRGSWRLIWNAHPKWLQRSDWGHKEALELYQIDLDPQEQNNVVKLHPQLISELMTEFKLSQSQKYSH